MTRKFSCFIPFLLVFSALLLGGCSKQAMLPMSKEALVAEAAKEINQISVLDTKSLFDKGDYLFLDCREPKEFKMGHIPGSVHIPRGVMEWNIEKKIPQKDTKIVMYCKSGGRSNLAAHTLKRMGYTNIKNMNGGWKDWEKAGYPVE